MTAQRARCSLLLAAPLRDSRPNNAPRQRWGDRVPPAPGGAEFCAAGRSRRLSSPGVSANAPFPDPGAAVQALRGTAAADAIVRLGRTDSGASIPVAWAGDRDRSRDPLASRLCERARKETDLAYFRRIPYLDAARAGDHKSIWELNRHQHQVLLAQAYLLTGRDEFPDEIERQLESWFRANPFPRGINWASALEVAFRALSWMWIDHLAGARLTAETRQRLREGLYRHGLHLDANLSVYFSPNTHLLGEAVALHALGLMFQRDAGRIVGAARGALNRRRGDGAPGAAGWQATLNSPRIITSMRWISFSVPCDPRAACGELSPQVGLDGGISGRSDGSGAKSPVDQGMTMAGGSFILLERATGSGGLVLRRADVFSIAPNGSAVKKICTNTRCGGWVRGPIGRLRARRRRFGLPNRVWSCCNPAMCIVLWTRDRSARFARAIAMPTR